MDFPDINGALAAIDARYASICRTLDADFKERPRYVPADGGNGFRVAFPRLDVVMRARDARKRATAIAIESTPQPRVECIETHQTTPERDVVEPEKPTSPPIDQHTVMEENAAKLIQNFWRGVKLSRLKRRLRAVVVIQSHVRRYLVQKSLAKSASLLSKARWVRKEHRDRVMKKCFDAWIDYCSTRRRWRRRMEHRLRLWGPKAVHRRAMDRPVDGHRARMIRTHEGTHKLATQYLKWYPHCISLSYSDRRRMATALIKLEGYTAFAPWIERTEQDGSAINVFY